MLHIYVYVSAYMNDKEREREREIERGGGRRTKKNVCILSKYVRHSVEVEGKKMYEILERKMMNTEKREGKKTCALIFFS